MAIKITISKQMVACDKQKTALVCFWSIKYHTRAFLGQGSVVYMKIDAKVFPRGLSGGNI
jgi:hypothetical protein